jgi:hypothetical protein
MQMNRAAELNVGSFHKIPAEIRANVNLEFQQWILNHIRDRQSFAIEATLRSPITFEHARLAIHCPQLYTVRSQIVKKTRGFILGANDLEKGAQVHLLTGIPHFSLNGLTLKLA